MNRMKAYFLIIFCFISLASFAVIVNTVEQSETSESKMWTYSIIVGGDYQLGASWIEVTEGDSVPVEIYRNEDRVKAFYAVKETVNRFEIRLEDLKANDKIYVKVSPKSASYRLAYKIAVSSPNFDGLSVFEVSTYGALGDGVTDDKAAIQAAVNAAANAGGIVRFDGAKTYRVIGLNDLTEEYLFELDGKSNVKIEGNGAKLLLHPPDRLAYFINTQNIQLDGFVIDYDPLPYYQGSIDAIDVNNLTIDITVPARYEVPQVGNTTDRSKYFGKIFIPESLDSRLGPGPHLYVDETSRINGAERKIRVQGRSDMKNAIQEALDKGATELVVPDFNYGQRGQWCASIVRSSCVTFSNLRFNKMLRQGLRPRQNFGPVTFSNVDILTDKPETELFVSWRGHWLAGDNRFGFLIEDGEYDAGCMYDDLFNFYSKMIPVKTVNNTSIILDPKKEDLDHWMVGDWVSFWSAPDQMEKRGMARIVAVSAFSNTIMLESAVSGVVATDIAVNEELMNRGTLVRNCSTTSQGAKRASCRIRTPAVFKDCHFENIYFWVYSSTIAEGGEGPRPRDVYFDNVYMQGGASRTKEMDVARAPLSVYIKNSTLDGITLDLRGCEKVVLDSLAFINMSGDIMKLSANCEGWLLDGTTRNGSAADITNWINVDASSTLHTTAPPNYPIVEPPLSGISSLDGIFSKEQCGYLNVYPNPTKGVLTIDDKALAKSMEVEIISTNGRLVKQFVLAPFQSDVDISGLSKGYYFFRLKTDSQVFVSRVFKL